MVPLPRLVKRWLFQASLWLLQGPPSRYRMPDPDYSIDQAHPTMTDEIPRLVAHGKLDDQAGDRRATTASAFMFKDGTRRRSTPIVFATGYQPVVPFIDESLVFDADGRPRFHAQRLSIPSMKACSRPALCRPTAACGGSPTTRAS